MAKLKVYWKWIRPWKLAGYYKKYYSGYRKHRCEVEDEPKEQRNLIFLHEDVVLITTKNRRTEKWPKFKTNLWLCINYFFNTKEKKVIGAIINAFQGKKYANSIELICIFMTLGLQ